MAWQRKLERIRTEVQGWPDLILLGRVVLLALLLPVLLRWLSLRGLMRKLTPPATRHSSQAPDVDRIVYLTDLVLGHLPLVRSTCLIRSLVLYRLLRTEGMEVQIHFGVRKAGSTLAGHCWLTHQGRPLTGTTSGNDFSDIYAYPPDANLLTGGEEEEQSLCAWLG